MCNFLFPYVKRPRSLKTDIEGRVLRSSPHLLLNWNSLSRRYCLLIYLITKAARKLTCRVQAYSEIGTCCLSFWTLGKDSSLLVSKEAGRIEPLVIWKLTKQFQDRSIPDWWHDHASILHLALLGATSCGNRRELSACRFYLADFSCPFKNVFI